MKRPLGLALFLLLLLPAAGLCAEDTLGYYRFPAIHGDTVVFAAEGDLWRVGRAGGTAARLTTHPAEESRPAISPDGRTLAFSASYEGPTEVYTMPIDGGLPVRRTFEGGSAEVVGWTPAGEVLYATSHDSPPWSVQLARLDPATGKRNLLPLAQASSGAFAADGKTLFFTRFAFQGSHTKRYQGGKAQSLWRFREGDAEAVPLTADFLGTSREPMPWNGRVYFASDRDGTMNLWSMDETGHDLVQHTAHRGWDVTSPSLSAGRIVYQLGADLRIFDLAASQDSALPVRLVSDYDQLRETWVPEPLSFLTALDLSTKGDRVALTARGQVFVAPVGKGRIVEASRRPGVRYRDARFLPDGKSLIALSDESGEVEVWKLPANGVGSPEQLTTDGKVLRWEAVPSPDGRFIAHRDKNLQLWLLDVKTRRQTRIGLSTVDDFQDLTWSPDSRWLAYAVPAANSLRQIFLYRVATGVTVPVTSDRFNSWSPVWSRDGQWLYFLSDRHLETLVRSPWGPYQPDPYLALTTQVFAVALVKGERFPFEPPDELHPAVADDESDEPAEKGKKEDGDEDPKAPPKGKGAGKDTEKDTGKEDAEAVRVKIDLDGLAERLHEVPVPPGNYVSLSASEKRLYWLSTRLTVARKEGEEDGEVSSLLTLAFDAAETSPVAPPAVVMADVEGYQLSGDGEKLLVQKDDELYVFDAGEEAPEDEDLAAARIDLSGWTFAINPREQGQQMFREAWRLERDYFYDLKMHGVDWPAMLEKYRPLSLRVTSRGELDDLLAQMVSELSALHTFVRGGDHRQGEDDVEVASLGAVLARDEAAGGWRVERLYRSDPDVPSEAGPLAASGVDVHAGDVLAAINGVATLSVADPGVLLRNRAGRQVLLRILAPPEGTSGRKGPSRKTRDVIVVPVSPAEAENLRYGDWELSRRLAVEKEGRGDIGYLHLRTMVARDYSSWARNFYPVFNRSGLILDLRDNDGGNIDSWILGKLLRKAWFWWQPRVGEPYSNMPYAFRGHLAVLVNEGTSSDGEAFAEGVRRLGLGKVIGNRTWGGEIWLTSSNFLVDRGIATAAEFGVYGPEGAWLIEGHGVDPDIPVENLPHATFNGKDAQLDAAVAYLTEKIKAEPVPIPKAPAYPDKSLRLPP